MRKTWQRVTRSLLVSGLAVVVLQPAAVGADEVEPAPLDRPGPVLSVPVADLEAAYACHGDFSSPLQPVLFVPGTGTTPEQAFAWNYGNYFTTEGRPFCTVSPPDESRGDIQVAAEYIVHAIRRTYEQGGRQIGVLGHSQGGMSPRWALRFWPDTRAMVADQIAMAGSNHGTSGRGCSESSPCSAAIWQQEPGSAFLTALNHGVETFAGIDYTSIYTRHDQTVPVTSAPLTTGSGAVSNVATQDVCPGSPWEHLTVGTVDPVTHALVIDALDQDGPADPSRIDPAVCHALTMPGVNLLDLRITRVLAVLANNLLERVPADLTGIPMTTAEPPLRCYVHAAGCDAATPTTGGATSTSKEPTPLTVADGVAAPVTPAFGRIGGGSGEVAAGSSSLPTTGLPTSAAGAVVGGVLVLVGLLLAVLGRRGTRGSLV